jgi:hypothetical protein
MAKASVTLIHEQSRQGDGDKTGRGENKIWLQHYYKTYLWFHQQLECEITLQYVFSIYIFRVIRKNIKVAQRGKLSYKKNYPACTQQRSAKLSYSPPPRVKFQNMIK